MAIIDIMMPGKDGLQLTKEIRETIDLAYNSSYSQRGGRR